MTDEIVISVEEAARRLGIGRHAAYRAIRAGQIPSIRIGNLYRIPLQALERMIAAIPVPPAQEIKPVVPPAKMSVSAWLSLETYTLLRAAAEARGVSMSKELSLRIEASLAEN
jgi:excisionase family DNA binding protein